MGKEAFATRCLECHDMTTPAQWQRGGFPNPEATIKRMDAKRKGWMHKSEIPFVSEYIRKVLSAKK